MQTPKRKQNQKDKTPIRTSSPKKQVRLNSKPKKSTQIAPSALYHQGLDLLYRGAPVKLTINFIAEQIETFLPGTSVLLCIFDTPTSRQTNGPGVPNQFLKLVRNMKQSEFQNTFIEKNLAEGKISTRDLHSHAGWTTLHQKLTSQNYRYGHTALIENPRGTCLGTISLLSKSKRPPTLSQQAFIESGSQIACLAIEDQRKKKEIKKLKAKLSNEVDDRTQKIREAIRQLQDEIVQRKIMERSLKTSNEKLQNLSNHLENVREEERTRISREIHDELGQMLTTLKMKLAILEERTLDEGFPIQEDLQAMMGLVETTLQTVRRISTELRPGILDVLGLSEALEWQAQEFQEQTKIRIQSEIQRLPENLGKDISTACFRICQEALTNVARHAKANHVTVSLRHEQGKLELIVRDNGKGITNEQLSRITSLGLIGMRERAQNLGGDLNIERAAPNGTEVSFSFPLELAD